MVIMGVDPGIASVGYGVVEYQNNRLKPLDFGTFHTGPEDTLPTRLRKIYDFLGEEIDRYRPDALSVEELFFNTNVKTAITVAHGRGVILLSGSL